MKHIQHHTHRTKYIYVFSRSSYFVFFTTFSMCGLQISKIWLYRFSPSFSCLCLCLCQFVCMSKLACVPTIPHKNLPSLQSMVHSFRTGNKTCILQTLIETTKERELSQTNRMHSCSWMAKVLACALVCVALCCC